ncbi:MAG TPA: EAL domain-containing protein [Acetobacteraceae bacterium]|nr:EAL domain-containing protein [Acetobacteraceae bacterium]
MRFRPLAFVPYISRPRGRQMLVAASLCLGLVLAAAMAYYAVTSRQAVIDDALREMRNDALLLAEDQDRLLQAADAVQRGLIEHMREIGIDSPETFAQVMASRAVQQNFRDRIAGLPYISGLLLLDSHGNLINFSRSWPPPPIVGEDRDFIRDNIHAGVPQPFVSAPYLGRVTNRWEVYLSRRFEAADGQLLGFVVSTIEISYFEQFYARLPLTGGGRYTLYRRDGTLIACYPHADAQIGKIFADTTNFNRLIGALNDGVVRQIGRFDGQDRLIVPQAMAHFPLIVSVSDTIASTMRSWRQEIRTLIGATVLLELAIACGTCLFLRHLRSEQRLLVAEKARTQAEADRAHAEERERAATTLQTQQQRFDIAAQNMLQGLIMVDHSGNILVVNRRFRELWGLKPDSIAPGTRYADMVAKVAGNVPLDDLAVIRRNREEAIARNVRSTFVWELSDGRTIAVTHQPMEDGWVATYEDITERRLAEAKIAHLARYDALTNLPNRALFREALDHALAFARRGQMLALHCLDLDQFKAVNDTLGHPVGDALLQAVAGRLRDGLRGTDTIARLGGDEFAIVQTGLDAPRDATGLADHLIGLIEAPFDVDGHQIVIGVSVGIAFAPADGLDPDVLLKNADLALYRAKLDGRGVYRLFHTEMDAEMQVRRVMELDLRQALGLGQFELFYQPLIDLHAQEAAGFEALLRWRHPERGMIPPDKFIPLAEEIGAIVPIGEWVLRQACAEAASWPGELRVSVNLSPVQFKSRDLVAMIAAALRDSGLPPGRLELEITETVMLQDTAATLATLHNLRCLGVRIAMDDFGTGYSSLSYLRRFPFDRIKIDQSFIRELGRQRDCGAIIRAVIGLSHELGMATTAEGVETREQLRALARAGCSDIQGYLFSRPVPQREISALLRSMPKPADLLRGEVLEDAESVA